MALGTVLRYSLQSMVSSAGSRTTTRILCQVSSLHLNPISGLASLLFLLILSCCLSKGVTPTSSRTRTPASVNATPANINIAGMLDMLTSSLKTTVISSYGSSYKCILKHTCPLALRLDSSCQRSPAKHDVPDVQRHSGGYRAGPESQHNAGPMGLQSVWLQWWQQCRRWWQQQRLSRTRPAPICLFILLNQNGAR